MTREESKKYIRSMLTGHHPTATHNHYRDVATAVDVIYYSLKSESKVITDDEAYLEAKEINEEEDTETSHVKLDDLLCKVLLSLGYDRLVKEFQSSDKWYS